MNLEIINNSSGIAYAKYYSSSTYGSDSSVETIYYNAGKAGIDYRFLEYGMSYSLSEDEDDSILSFIREQDLSGKVSSEIEFLNDTILPGGSDLCPYYPDDTYIPQTNSLNFFGSFVVGLKNIYVFHVPELVWKIELFENLPAPGENESPVIRITLNNGLEWEYEEYVFLSSTQNSSQSTPDVNISYEAWKKLINPLRNKKKRNLQSTSSRVSQLEEPIQGIYFDGASGTILGTKKEESTPILDSMKSLPTRFSSWRNYKKGESTLCGFPSVEYVSLVDNNIGEVSPIWSNKWAKKSTLINLTKTIGVICNHGIFEFNGMSKPDEVILNMFDDESQKSIKLLLPAGVSIDLNSLQSMDLNYLTKMNSVEKIEDTGERYSEIILLTDSSVFSEESVEIPVIGADVDILIKVKDPDGNYITFGGGSTEEYSVNFVNDEGRIKDYVEIDLDSVLDVDNHPERGLWLFSDATGINNGISVEGRTVKITPEASIELRSNPIVVESILNKISILVANSGDFYVQDPYREVEFGGDTVFAVYPITPGDTINLIWINKKMDGSSPHFVVVPDSGIIPQTEYLGIADEIAIEGNSIRVTNIYSDLRLDIVKDEN